MLTPAQVEWMSSCYSRPHYRVETGMLFPNGSINDTQMQKVNRNTDPRLHQLPFRVNNSPTGRLRCYLRPGSLC